MVNLGNIYEEREDFEKAYYWYREAALADNEQGMFNVANMHFRGWHVAQYYHQKAKDYYEKGIEEATSIARSTWAGCTASGWAAPSITKKDLTYTIRDT